MEPMQPIDQDMVQAYPVKIHENMLRDQDFEEILAILHGEKELTEEAEQCLYFKHAISKGKLYFNVSVEENPDYGIPTFNLQPCIPETDSYCLIPRDFAKDATIQDLKREIRRTIDMDFAAAFLSTRPIQPEVYDACKEEFPLQPSLFREPSPWGTIDYVSHLGQTAKWVSTPTHGGLVLHQVEWNRLMQQTNCSKANNAGIAFGPYVGFEEDCACSIPLVMSPILMKLQYEKVKPSASVQKFSFQSFVEQNARMVAAYYPELFEALKPHIQKSFPQAHLAPFDLNHEFSTNGLPAAVKEAVKTGRGSKNDWDLVKTSSSSDITFDCTYRDNWVGDFSQTLGILRQRKYLTKQNAAAAEKSMAKTLGKIRPAAGER